MNLGTFSVSLAVEDLATSRDFYKKLGFEVMPNEFEDHPTGASYDRTWVLLRLEGTVIGLFQKMFEKNTLTFNPPDVRAVQRTLKKAGVELAMEADESSTGPAFAMLADPDGNPILLDQHND